MKTSRWTAAALVALTGVVGGGVAHAFWSVGGSGSGSATNGNLQLVTLEALAGADVPAAGLVPGGTTDVYLRVHNPNSVPVQVYSVSSNGPVTADGDHPGCTTTGVTFTAPAAPIGTTVDAGTTEVVLLADAASMDNSSSSACQGATFHLPVALTVRR